MPFLFMLDKFSVITIDYEHERKLPEPFNEYILTAPMEYAVLVSWL
jgi:hypothetical protein